MSEPVFVMHPNGVTEMDENKLKIIATSGVGVQSFFAAAILDVMEKLQRGELKGIRPSYPSGGRSR